MIHVIISAVIGGVIGVVGFWVAYYLFSGGHKKEWQISDEESRICYIEKNSELDDLSRRTIDEYNKKLYAENKLDLIFITADELQIRKMLDEEWTKEYLYVGRVTDTRFGVESTIVLDHEMNINKLYSSPYGQVNELYVYKKEQPELGLAVLE